MSKKKKLPIVMLGDKMLRTKAKQVSAKEIKTKKFQDFVDNLIKTCDMSGGVGIAAPQVGESKRVFILWSRTTKKRKNIPKLGPIVIINPRIILQSKKMIKGWEGCLSIPTLRGIVKRYEWVDVEFINHEGEKMRMTFEEFPARIFQHELDHLNGVVFLDRTDPKDLVAESEYKKIIKREKEKTKKSK